jgi:hypothetical protein
MPGRLNPSDDDRAAGHYPGPMTDPRLRASDADRQRVVKALQEHAAAGRLTLDEYADRVDVALAARTHADLGGVTADLPVVAELAGADEDRGHLILAFLVAALVVVAFAVVLQIAR